MNLRYIGDDCTEAKWGDGLEVSELYQGFNNMKEGNEYKYQRSMLHRTRFLLTSLVGSILEEFFESLSQG